MSIHCPPILVNFYSLTAPPYYKLIQPLHTYKYCKKSYLYLSTIRNLSFFSVPLVLTFLSFRSELWQLWLPWVDWREWSDCGVFGVWLAIVWWPWKSSSSMGGGIGNRGYVLYVCVLSMRFGVYGWSWRWYVLIAFCSLPWKVEEEESETSKGNSNVSNVTNGSDESNGTEEEVWQGSSEIPMPEFSSFKPWISCDFS